MTNVKIQMTKPVFCLFEFCALDLFCALNFVICH